MPMSKLRFSENLTVAVGHVEAVRGVYHYLNGGGLSDDWGKVHQHLKQQVERRYPRLRPWLYTPGGCDSSWQPLKWQQAGISLGIYTPSPVEKDDPDAYAYLFVPEDWRNKKRLDARLLDLQRRRCDFAHYQQPQYQGYLAENPVWVWVRYEEFVKRGGRFDWAGFIDALVKAFGVLYRLEPEVDKVVSASPRAKRSRA